MAGRPLLLTPARHAQIVEQIRRGAYYNTTAAFAQISERTLHTWLARGYNEQQRIDAGAEPSETEAPFLRLSQDVQEAQAYAELYAMDKWRDAIPTDWRAAKDFLALRFPERWASSRDRGEVTVTHQQDPQTAIVAADAARLAGIVRAVIDGHVPVSERAAAIETVRELMMALPRADDAPMLGTGTDSA